MHLLETTGLMKTYGKRCVVESVDINIKRGEVVGLLGPNGAGKTTTFYMITGLIATDRGRIVFDRQDITSMPMHMRARSGIGYLSQEPSIKAGVQPQAFGDGQHELRRRTRRSRSCPRARAAPVADERYLMLAFVPPAATAFASMPPAPSSRTVTSSGRDHSFRRTSGMHRRLSN
jgi:Fe-S cluster assembly ATPase SufC